MKVDTPKSVRVTMANRNFSAVARGGNRCVKTDDEKIDLAAKRVMAKCKSALIELAK